jgi:hypothetical protein
MIDLANLWENDGKILNHKIDVKMEITTYKIGKREIKWPEMVNLLVFPIKNGGFRLLDIS